MTLEEAKKIYKSWQDFMEIADKFLKLFLPVPESFLPYPSEVIEECLNIMSKYYFDSGDKKCSDLIQETKCLYLSRCKKDEEALVGMKKHLNFIFKHPKLTKTLIEKLHESRDSWIRFRENGNVPE